jgi:MYXO-CTERM domain-containing protein
MTRRFAAMAVTLGAAGTAFGQAQVQATVTYTLSMTEVNAATYLPSAVQNGVVDQDEAVRFEVSLSFTPDFGSHVTFSPAIQHGTSGSGTIQGFWNGAFDLVLNGGAASPSTAGTWVVTGGPVGERLGYKSPFAAGSGGDGNTPFAGGARFQNIQPAQFGPDVDALASTNPVSMVWRGIWIPTNRIQQAVTCAFALNSFGIPTASMAIRDDLYYSGNPYTLPVALTSNYVFGAGVSTSVIPAPGAAALLLGMGGVTAARRRRVVK